MSSLRLALKQSLQETGHLFKDKKRKSGSNKNNSNKSNNSNRRRSRQPGDPPRKRGRPRKHPLPEEQQQQQYQQRSHNSQYHEQSENSETREGKGNADGTGINRRGSGDEVESESENEFSYDSEDEEEDSEEDQEEGEDHEEEENQDQDESNHDQEEAEPQASGPPEEDELHGAGSTGGDESAKPEEAESVEERRRRRKFFKKHLQQAANKIQAQWKRKAGIKTSPYEEREDESYEDGSSGGAPPRPREMSPMRKRDTSSTSNVSTPTPGDRPKKKKDTASSGSSGSSRSQTVPPPEPEVLDWNRGLPEKKCRKNISAGLRVKVRFAAKVKREGKVVKKKIWYGGRVSAVSKEGSKIRIKYDDGTSEISKFPDKDVVVDDTFNGKHLVMADKFVPPGITEEREEDPEQTEGNKDMEGETKSENEPEVVKEVNDDSSPVKEEVDPSVSEPSTRQDDVVIPAAPAAASVPAEIKSEKPTSTHDATSKQEEPAKKEESLPSISTHNVADVDKSDDPKEKVGPKERLEPMTENQPAPVPKKESTSDPEPSKEVGSESKSNEVTASETKPGEATTPLPRPTSNMIASAITAAEDGRLPRDTGSPEEGELSPGLSLLSRAQDTVTAGSDTKKSEESEAAEPDQRRDDKMPANDNEAGTKSEEPSHVASAAEQEVISEAEIEAENGVGQNPGAANNVEVQDLKQPADDTAELESTRTTETEPKEEPAQPASPSTPKLNLMIRISNSNNNNKSDQESNGKDTPKTPKANGSDSEEELFADTPVTERKVKSIQLKRKSKRKHDAPEALTEEQPSKKRIHLKCSKPHETEEDLAMPDVEESVDDKSADVEGAVEALSALADPARTDEESHKPNTKITISIRKPEAEEGELPMLPKLKKRDRAESPVAKGRSSPVPESRSPIPQIDAATNQFPTEPEAEPAGTASVEDAAPLSPRRAKSIALARGSSSNEPDEVRAEASLDDGTEVETSVTGPLSRSKSSAESLSGVRSGRRAARQAKEKMNPKQEDKTLESDKKKKKRKRKDGEEETDQSDESVDDRQWVQCDSCGKWRILPSSVKISSLPKHWYCYLNTHDQKRNNCSAPEQSAKQAAKEWKKARRRAKQQRLAGIQAQDTEKAQEEVAVEIKKEVGSASPKPTKGAKKERTDNRRSSPVGAEESQVSVSGSEATKLERKGKKSKQQQPAPPEIVEPPTPTPVPEAEAPKKPGRKRGRPARNQTPQKENDENENVEWVQCEMCEKWRKLPPHISADELPDTWYCSMNNWNPEAASCNVAEDKADATHHEVGNYAGMFGANAGKYSYRSMIFGTGKKHNRPMSERSRAAESLFMRPIDEIENHYPTVMYSKSSCFLPRTSNFTKASVIEDEKPPGIFDVLSNSELWVELRSVGQPVQVESGPTGKSYPKFMSFENLPDDIKEAMRDIVLRSLGKGTLTGDDVIREVQQYPWESSSYDLASIRGYFNADIIINTLLALVRDGVVEMTSMRNLNVPIGQWVPKYRKVRSLRAMKIEESIKSSRCMKISKPWKKSDWITGCSAFS